MLKEKKSGESSVLFDAQEALTNLKGLIVRSKKVRING